VAIEGPAWLVGGAVRDLLLGRPLHDLDLAVPAGSVAAARRLADRVGGAFVPLGEAHGVARVIVAGPPPLQVDLADFRGPTLEADLAGRDVTIDALAVPLDDLAGGAAAAVVDPTGGLADLRDRRLRACGPAAFADDPVRAVRLLRLAHTLGFGIEPATERLARAVVPALASTAAERVRDELTRALRLPRSAAAVREADAWSIIDVLFPETVAMRTATQSPPHRFTVWEHSLRALAALDDLLADLELLGIHADRVARHLAEPVGGDLTRREVLRLATLLHDVAKPETRSVDPDGRVRFIGHDRLGAERAEAIGGRLAWPNRATAILARLVRHHLRPMHLGMLDAVSPRARYRFFRDVGEEVPDLVCLTIADAAGTDGRPLAAVWRGPTRTLLDGLLVGQVEAVREAAVPPLLRGGDVMAAFGLTPGPEVGRLLARAREAQALGLVGTREEALAWLARDRGESPAVPVDRDDAGGPGSVH
jgi:putative nucleotidyltransferase with HDIG domain